MGERDSGNGGVYFGKDHKFHVVLRGVPVNLTKARFGGGYGYYERGRWVRVDTSAATNRSVKTPEEKSDILVLENPTPEDNVRAERFKRRKRRLFGR